jgi:hypothetical protein
MSLSPTVPGAGESSRREDDSRCRVLGVATSAAVFLIAATLFAQPNSAKGQTHGPAGSGNVVEADAPTGRPESIAEIRRVLTGLQDRIIKLADQVLAYDDDARIAQDQIGSQKIRVEAAKIKSEQAKIACELAQIKVRQYQDGQFALDLALVEGEIKNAEEDLKVAPARTSRAKERLNEIKKASRESTVDILMEYDAERRVTAEQWAEQAARFVLEQAKSKKRVLVEYTKAFTIQQLRSNVEKARSEELAANATWELESAKVKQLERDAAANRPPTDAKQVLVLLDQAIAFAERIRGMVAQLNGDGKHDESIQKEMDDATSRLRAIVEEADATWTTLLFDKMKPRIHQSAGRIGVQKN